MRRVALTMALILPTVFCTAQAEDAAADAHQKIASEYFRVLTSGDIKRANELIGIPYSLDRRKVLKTKEEVAAMHEKIIADKGKRKVPEFTIAKTDNAPALEFAVAVKYFAYRVMVGDEHIDIYVTQGKDPRVIGFSD